MKSDNYESAIEYISEAESTEAYSKTVDTKTVVEGSGSFTYEREVDKVRKVVLASKYDVVHKFVLKGTSSYGYGIDGINNFDSIASTALEQTE